MSKPKVYLETSFHRLPHWAFERRPDHGRSSEAHPDYFTWAVKMTRIGGLTIVDRSKGYDGVAVAIVTG